MPNRRHRLRLSLAAGAIAGIGLAVMAAAPLRPDLLSGLTWRNVGPFRAGRISAVSGAIGEPGTFYMGTPAGGVWKTTSAGVTWEPIFDVVKDVSSIGSVEVAPSDPNTVYVGTGDQVTGGVINEGNGVYKSTDAGRTWKHVGLVTSKHIPSLIVDPRNPNIVLAAARGDVHAKGGERGVYRSTDGGSTWTRTLFVADTIGIQKLAIAFDRPDVVYATTIRQYTPPPPPSGIAPAPAPGGGGRGGAAQATGVSVWKSTDGGVTWTELKAAGLPPIPSTRTSIAVAMRTDARRVFVVGTNGLFRSDDGGATWRQVAADDQRIRDGQGGYNTGLFIDPVNPDVVYVFNTASYKSTDGGNTFTGFKGAPGGDDPQAHWIDPTNGNRMLLGYDQGAIVTLDGGRTWSPWYNQSTEQVYHISVDNSWPYWIYATQQDAGAIRTRHRGNMGAVTMFDWNAVNGWEWGTIIPDPKNANVVYASGSGIVKISYPSEQWINVSPAVDPDSRMRSTSSAPLAWAPWDQNLLLAGTQYVLGTTDGGLHWRKLSPDISWPKGMTPPPDTAAPQPGGFPAGAMETLAASSVGRGIIWAGFNNGVIKVTRDEGKTWDDASIPGIPFTARALVEGLATSPTVAGEAYAAVDLLRVGDYAPYLYRTKDFGKTWTKITSGLRANEPAGSSVRTVAADPKRPGLLYAGTETGVYVSFDDGDNWQPLMGGLPNTSYRSFAFQGSDVVVGTYGRGIYVLDGGAVLRQMNETVADAPVHLFTPDRAVRMRRNVNADTPLPPEVPHAVNPPSGAIIWYYLAAKPAGEITMDVLDSTGTVIRHLSSVAAAPVAEAARPPHPNFWVAPPYALPANAGLNRGHWDMRHDAPPTASHSFEISANPGETPASPEGALAPPGTYTVRLTVNGNAYSEKLVVTNDPRSPATAADVRAQATYLAGVQAGIRAAWAGTQQAAAYRTALTAAMPSDTASEAARAIRAFRARVDLAAGGGGSGRGGFGGRGGGGRTPATFQSVHGRLITLLGNQENGDHAPTEAAVAAYGSACKDLTGVAAKWKAIGADLQALNAVLTKAGAKAVPAAAGVTVPKC